MIGIGVQLKEMESSATRSCFCFLLTSVQCTIPSLSYGRAEPLAWLWLTKMSQARWSFLSRVSTEGPGRFAALLVLGNADMGCVSIQPRRLNSTYMYDDKAYCLCP